MTIERHGQGAPTLYTAEEAAEVLRVRKSWLERQAAARKIPFTMLGGSYRFTVAHLAAIVQMHEEAPAPPAEIRLHNASSRRHGTRQHPVGRGLAPLRPRPRSGPGRVADHP